MALVNAMRRAMDIHRDPVGPGWATRSFVDSMSSVSLWGIALFQLLAVGALLFEPPGHRPVLLLGAVHFAVAACALGSRVGRVPVSATIVGAYGAFLADWSLGATWNGPLLLASCWIANTAAALPGLTISRPRINLIPLIAAWVVPALMVVTRPDLGPQLPGAVIVTATSIVTVFWFGLVYPLDFVRRADAQEADAHDRDQQLAAQRAAVQKTAEDARVLHDTVINTLGAIARGGAAVADVGLVRDRCRLDVATVEALDRGEESLPGDDVGVRAAVASLGITVHHAGLSDEELATCERALPDGVRRAATRAVFELVRNVAKHAEVDEATVTATLTDGALTLVVEDEGRGFDTTVQAGSGLAESVLNRAREQGIDVTIDTTPGRGTRVTLTCWDAGRPDGASDARDASDVEDLVGFLVRRAGFAYAVGVAAVGLVLAISNHAGRFTEEYYMVLAIALATAIAWRASRDGRIPGPLVQLILIAGGCVAFVASAASVDYGRTDVVLWQAIGPIGPLALLLALTRSRPAGTAAAWAYGATIVGVIATTYDGNLQAAANVVIAGLVGLGLLLGWSRFQRSLLDIGTRAAADHRRAAALQRELVAQAAATEARRRWQAAGLSESITLLRSIVEGSEPSDPALRDACGREESYLRKLTQLEPELIHMGPWFAGALAEGHASDADVIVRSGSLDIAGADAAQVGELVVQAARRVRAGEHLTATLYAAPNEADDLMRLTLVGPRPLLSEAAGAWSDANRYAMTLQSFGEQELLEIEIALSGEQRTGHHELTEQGASA